MKTLIMTMLLAAAMFPSALALEEVPTTDKFLLFDERGDYQVGIQSIETRDLGERGILTSVEVFVQKSPRDTLWRQYDVVLEVGRWSGDFYSNWGQRTFHDVSLRRVSSGDTFVFEMINERGLPVTFFNDDQRVSITLNRGNNDVARASGVFDLSKFA